MITLFLSSLTQGEKGIVIAITQELSFSSLPTTMIFWCYRPIFCLIFGKIWGNFRIFFGKISEICKIQFSGILSYVDDQYTL